MNQNNKTFTYDRVIEQVERIPYGRVATYGQIAALAACSARQAGYALATVPVSSPVPWHRVINSQGKISIRNRGDGERLQRDLLEEEGVYFNSHGKVDLEEFGYRP